MIILGCGQADLKLLLVWILSIWIFIEHRKGHIKCAKPNWVLGILAMWWVAMLIPFPLDWHNTLTPFVADNRTPVLQYLEFSKYPLSVNPYQHLLDGTLLWCSFCVLHSKVQWSEDSWRNGIIYFATVFCLVGLVQRFYVVNSILGFYSTSEVKRDPFFSTFVNGNHAGYFIAAAMTLIPFSKMGIFRQWLLLSFLFISVWLTGSRGALLTSIIFPLMGIYKLPLRQYWKTTSFVIMTVILGVFFIWIPIENDWSHGRLNLWKDAIEILSQIGLLGGGFNSFGDLFAIVKSNPEYIYSSHAHQEILEWLVSTGVTGGTVLLWTIYRTISNRSISFGWSLFLGVFLVASFVDFPLQLGALFLLVIIICRFFVPDTDNTIPPLLVQTILFVLLMGVSYVRIQIGNSDTLPNIVQRPLNPTIIEKFLYSEVQQSSTSQYKPELNKLIEQHARSFPTNIEAKVLLARWYRATEQYDESCSIWDQVWGLDTPIKSQKLELVAESLACNPNLWSAIISLPDDVPILVESYKVLNAQKLYTHAQFCLDRAHDLREINPLGSLHLTRWHIEQSQWDTAWNVHRSIVGSSWTKETECLYLKNQADLRFNFSVQNNHLDYQMLIEQCGNKPYWNRRKMISQLKEGKSQAILWAENKITDSPKEFTLLWKLLINAYQIQKNPSEACRLIEKAFHKGQTTLKSEQIQRCAIGSMPFKNPYIEILSDTEVDRLILE